MPRSTISSPRHFISRVVKHLLPAHQVTDECHETNRTLAVGDLLPISVIDNVCWLFEALVIGDMVMLLCGSKESENPYRLTSATKQTIRDAVPRETYEGLESVGP